MSVNTIKTTRTDQLRVRLRREEREALENVIQKRGKNETISDVIREALAWCLHPDLKKQPCYLSQETFAKVKALAIDLNREPDQVVEDCISGILDLVDKPDRKVPLIVMEVQLRRKYESEKIKKNKASQ